MRPAFRKEPPMPPKLTEAQRAECHEQGVTAPVPILTTAELRRHRAAHRRMRRRDAAAAGRGAG
jgi:hypothetical protein